MCEDDGQPRHHRGRVLHNAPRRSGTLSGRNDYADRWVPCTSTAPPHRMSTRWPTRRRFRSRSENRRAVTVPPTTHHVPWDPVECDPRHGADALGTTENTSSLGTISLEGSVEITFSAAATRHPFRQLAIAATVRSHGGRKQAASPARATCTLAADKTNALTRLATVAGEHHQRDGHGGERLRRPCVHCRGLASRRIRSEQRHCWQPTDSDGATTPSQHLVVARDSRRTEFTLSAANETSVNTLPGRHYERTRRGERSI